MNIQKFKRPITKAMTIEVILIFISFLAVQASGGHSGMMVAMALHLPTSILGIIVAENIELNTSPESFFYMVSASTIILHMVLMTVFLSYIQNKRQ